jgi:vesicle-associated membrane protein 7
VFHYIVEGGITYLCLADEKNKRRIPFLYLDDMKVRALKGSSRTAEPGPLLSPRATPPLRPPRPLPATLPRQAKFQAAYGARAATAIAFAMNTEFARILQDRMDFFNDNPGADSFGKVKNQIEDVKGVMVENIEKVLARGEKIELLVDKTEALNQSAKKFQKASKSLKDAMWWKNVKMYGMIFMLVTAVVVIIVGFATNWKFGQK